MERSALFSPWRILLGLLPLLYGGVLLIDVAGTFFWSVVIGIVLLGLLFVVCALGYPLIACWPAFPAFFVLFACAIMLVQGVPVDRALPVTHSPLELWCISALAVGVIIWSSITTRQVLSYR